MTYVPDRPLDPPNEYYEGESFLEKEEKEKADILVNYAIWHLNISVKKGDQNKIVWYKKVVLRCEDIRDNLHKKWSEIS